MRPILVFGLSLDQAEQYFVVEVSSITVSWVEHENSIVAFRSPRGGVTIFKNSHGGPRKPKKIHISI